jgi:hypothetical protein
MSEPLGLNSRDSTFPPLRLVEDHLVALEGLLLLASARAFDRRAIIIIMPLGGFQPPPIP